MSSLTSFIKTVLFSESIRYVLRLFVPAVEVLICDILVTSKLLSCYWCLSCLDLCPLYLFM